MDLRQQLAIARLPALPQALLKVLEICDREDTGLLEIGQVVRQDAGITARLVSIANSPYYSRGRTLSDIDQCLAVLGTTTVGRIALNQAVVDLFSRFKGVQAFDMAAFWRHTLSTALLARHLAEQWSYGNVEEAYLAGLLHDVGQLALLSVAGEHYAPLTDGAADEEDLLLRERRALQIDHADAGAMLAQHWGLQPLFVDALRYHHQPLERLKDAHALARLVALADRLEPWLEDSAAIPQDWLSASHLDPGRIALLAESVSAETARVAEQFGIALPPAGTRRAPGAADDLGQLGRLADATVARLEAKLGIAAQAGATPQAHLALAQGASLVFGSTRAALFLPQGPSLVGISPEDDSASRMAELRVALPNADSAIVQAHAGQIVLHDWQSASSLVDAQVGRLLGGTWLMCLPLAHGGDALGVLVLGLDSARAASLGRRRNLLAAFAAEAGRQLATVREQERQVAQCAAGLAARYNLHTRQVVHEMSNPLSVVRNYLSMLRTRLAQEGQAVDDLALLEDELRRVGRLLHDLRQVDAGELPPLQAMDANKLIEEVVRFCRLDKLDPARFEVRLLLEDDLPMLPGNPDKLRQILSNLMYNAAEAMPKGGMLTLSSGRWRGMGGRDTVEIGIADNGPGLPDALLAQLDQPKTSSKGGAHAGLGLSIVSSLVEQLGGELQCKSGPTGTQFKIHLPAAVQREGVAV